MMLSQLVLNERHSGIYHDLDNLNALHQRIMQAFPDEAGPNARSTFNVLYRREPGVLTILVQSAAAPDWARLPAGYLDRAQTTEMDPLLERLAPGLPLRFRLLANPTKRDNQSRKVIALARPEEQEAWLQRQAARAGFEITGLRIGPAEQSQGRRKGIEAAVTLRTVLFDGTLRVTDADALREAVRHGSGRGRSYGCGLLSLAPLPID